MRNSALRCYVRLLLLPLAPLSLAQQTPPAPQQTQSAVVKQASAKSDTYASESIVIEHADVVYTFAADGTGTRERTIAARVQSEAAVRALGVVGIPYAGNSEQVEIVYARVRRPDGTVVSTQAADALDMPEEVTRQAPFYSDLKQKQIPIRSLHVGDTLEWKARIIRTKPEAPGQFWGAEMFTQDTVVLAETIELRVPKSSYVNVWSPTLKPAESTEGDQHIYRWATSQLKPTAGKQAEADSEAKKKLVLTADEELDADQGKLPSIAWTTFKSWQDVGLWYRSLSADRATPSPEIKAKAAELIAGKVTDEEKIRALYTYVATQFRYIGVAFGVGRYQPHPASEILENQYGDCKDKHTLLASLLAAAGFHADAVLIGAGIRFNPDVPSPTSFNHLITRLITPGKFAEPIWLDTTAEIAPYRMLFATIRDKQALVVPDAAAPRLERTPADPPFPSFSNWKAIGTLYEDGVSNSRITYSTRGDEELIYRTALRQTTPAQYPAAIQQISQLMGYQGTATHPDFGSPDDTVQPLTWSYDYKREQGGDWEHYKIIPQTKYSSVPTIDEKNPPIQSVELGWPRTETSHAEMTLPDNWGAVLPEATHAKSEFATLDQTFSFEKGVLSTDLRVVVLKEKVPASRWKEYQKWTEQAGLTKQLYIQLTRTSKKEPATKEAAPKEPAGVAGSNSKSTTPDGPPVLDATAAKVESLMESVADLAQRHDLEGLGRTLDRVKELNPEQAGLWRDYSALALQRGQIDEAIVDLHKEVKLHPDSYEAYQVLVDLQTRLGKSSDAEGTLRDWVAAQPGNASPATKLMALQIEDGNPAAALAVGEAALGHLPEDERKDESFQLALGNAQIDAGDKQKGEATFEALLKDSEDPEILNHAVSVLADASLDLPLAEDSSRTALRKLTQESSAWTLRESAQTLHDRTKLTVSTWDSLGWVLFREGKLQEAQTYLQAAWLGRPNIDTGKRLAEVLAARGNKSAALITYELAVASEPAYNALGVRTELSAKAKALQARADALRKAGIKASGEPVQNQLQHLRIVQLGPANGRAGDAEYRLLLKEGKAIKVEPSGTKTVAGASEMIGRASFAAFFPSGSQTALVRIGFVNCHSSVCELMLEP
jgi:tetratricopeptide (TPR) repeat protein